MFTFKHIRIFYFLLVCMVSVWGVSGCNGNFSSDSTSSTSQDNSVDNSQHGISSCSQGSSFVCTESGPGEFTQSEECRNVNGQVVVLSGPEPIDSSLAEACPTPEPAVAEGGA